MPREDNIAGTPEVAEKRPQRSATQRVGQSPGGQGQAEHAGRRGTRAEAVVDAFITRSVMSTMSITFHAEKRIRQSIAGREEMYAAGRARIRFEHPGLSGPIHDNI